MTERRDAREKELYAHLHSLVVELNDIERRRAWLKEEIDKVQHDWHAVRTAKRAKRVTSDKS